MTEKQNEPSGWRLWLATHPDWAYWVIAILGVVGMAIVAYYYLRHSGVQVAKGAKPA